MLVSVLEEEAKPFMSLGKLWMVETVYLLPWIIKASSSSLLLPLYFGRVFACFRIGHRIFLLFSVSSVYSLSRYMPLGRCVLFLNNVSTCVCFSKQADRGLL